MRERERKFIRRMSVGVLRVCAIKRERKEIEGERERYRRTE